MIEDDYAAPYERALDSHEFPASELYWLAVRAGVAGRRAERADAVRLARDDADDLAGAARQEHRESRASWAGFAAAGAARSIADRVMVGHHVGAARKAK